MAKEVIFYDELNEQVHPVTSASAVKCADGKSVEDKINAGGGGGSGLLDITPVIKQEDNTMLLFFHCPEGVIRDTDTVGFARYINTRFRVGKSEDDDGWRERHKGWIKPAAYHGFKPRMGLYDRVDGVDIWYVFLEYHGKSKTLQEYQAEITTEGEHGRPYVVGEGALSLFKEKCGFWVERDGKRVSNIAKVRLVLFDEGCTQDEKASSYTIGIW